MIQTPSSDELMLLSIWNLSLFSLSAIAGEGLQGGTHVLNVLL